MRKLLSTVAAICLAGGVAYSANIPLFTGPAVQEPNQQLAVINTLVQSINSGTYGLNSFVPGPVSNSGTTVNVTMAQASVPTGALTSAGQGYRARCAGIMSAGTTNATVAIQIGNVGSIVQSLSTVTIGQPWDIELVIQAATNPVTANSVFFGKAFSGPATGSATNFMSVNSGQDTSVTNNNVNFALPIKCISALQYTAIGTVTMEDFSVEQVR